MKGESRGEEEDEGGGGSRQNNGGGRAERRSEIWEEKAETMDVMAEGEGIGRRLSQLLRGVGGGREVCMGGTGREEREGGEEEGMGRGEVGEGKFWERWGGWEVALLQGVECGGSRERE